MDRLATALRAWRAQQACKNPAVQIWPSDWDEDDYLLRHPDVAGAVRSGQFRSGHDHFLSYGQREQRARSVRQGPGDARLTRLCHDPWVHLEVAASGALRPCCISTPIEGQDVRGADRNHPQWRALRQALLSGELPGMCRSCHIRPAATVEALRTSLAGAGITPSDPTDAGPLQSMRVDVNEQCNLRCTYCAVSQPGYEGIPMAHNLFGAVLALVDAHPGIRIDLNGHGETTFHPGWLGLATQIHDRGAPTTILSNFARLFSEAEATAFARMQTIQISLDAADADFLKEVRRKVSLATIRRNIALIRARAEALGLAPEWTISAGIYDLNVEHLEGLAEFAIANRFAGVTFWTLVEYPVVPGGPHARPLESLAPAERAAAQRVVLSVADRLRAAGVVVHLPPNLTAG